MKLMSQLKAMETQNWIMGLAILVLFVVVSYFIKTELEYIKSTLRNYGGELQNHSKKFAYMEGEGTATSRIAETFEKASMTIAGAIKEKYGRK